MLLGVLRWKWHELVYILKGYSGYSVENRLDRLRVGIGSPNRRPWKYSREEDMLAETLLYWCRCWELVGVQCVFFRWNPQDLPLDWCGLWENKRNQGWHQSVCPTINVKLLFTEVGNTEERTSLGKKMTSWNLDNFVVGSYWIATGAVK